MAEIQRIEIEELYELFSDGELGDPMWLFCKGHISSDDFIPAAHDWAEWEGEDEYVITPADVRQDYARNIPCRDERGNWTHRVELCKPGRGAYPITYVDIS